MIPLLRFSLSFLVPMFFFLKYLSQGSDLVQQVLHEKMEKIPFKDTF